MCQCGLNSEEADDSSIDWAKLQANNGSISLFNDPEEDAWDELF